MSQQGVPASPKVLIVSEIYPLDSMKCGESGRIVELVGSDVWKHRMQELGLREGGQVQVVQCGEPCIIAIGAQRMSFRCDSSMMILVEVTPQQTAVEIRA